MNVLDLIFIFSDGYSIGRHQIRLQHDGINHKSHFACEIHVKHLFNLGLSGLSLSSHFRSVYQDAFQVTDYFRCVVI